MIVSKLASTQAKQPTSKPWLTLLHPNVGDAGDGQVVRPGYAGVVTTATTALCQQTPPHMTSTR